MTVMDEFEVGARRRKWEQIAAAHAADAQRQADLEVLEPQRAAAGPGALAILRRLVEAQGADRLRRGGQEGCPSRADGDLRAHPHTVLRLTHRRLVVIGSTRAQKRRQAGAM